MAILCTMFGPVGDSRARENGACMACHQIQALTGDRDGRETSMYVNPGLYARSVHAALACVACHADLVAVALPHSKDVKPADCALCHENAAADHARSVHASAAAGGDELMPGCAHCHGKHDILSHQDASSPTASLNVPVLCGRCHHEGEPVRFAGEIAPERVLENYSMNLHGEGLLRGGLRVAAACTSCHGAHLILPPTEPESNLHADRLAATCSRCHGQIAEIHRQAIEPRLWTEQPDKIPVCVDCHAPHETRRALSAQGSANQNCMSCHGSPSLSMTRDGKTVSLFVEVSAYNASVHGATACAQCHTGVTPSETRPCTSVDSKVDCGVCHAEQVSAFGDSVHGMLLAQGRANAPSCQDCHTKHAELSSAEPRSPTFVKNVPILCGECHRRAEAALGRDLSEELDIVDSYIDSIHGKGLLESGLLVTATCKDCHGSHGALPPSDSRSTLSSKNIVATCGACHFGISELVKTSVHWPDGIDRSLELPTCKECHSAHTIARTDTAAFRLRVMDQCGSCHEREAQTYFNSFHGKVSRLGAAVAAKCHDCHGTHVILPSSHPASKLSPDNVVETCRQCHQAAHYQFTGYLSHANYRDRHKHPWLFWSFWGMTILLVGTLSLALLHALAWLARLWLTRKHWQPRKSNERSRQAPTKQYERFNRFQRGLHLALIISVFTLALTGMALKFAHMPWAQWTAWLLGGFESMGTLHRMGAIALFCVVGLHIWDIRRRKNKAGKTWRQVMTDADTIIFNLGDAKEFTQSVKWFFGLGPRPRYGRYTYWEKFDYFAVFWGIAVIGVTGLILWFPELVTYVIPGWSVNVATIIHSDEALLAVGFIFTIHFFNAHLRPDKFPMDPVIFTGLVSIEQLKDERPREYEQRVASGQLAAHLVEPCPGSVDALWKSFGALALSGGVVLLMLIVYTMLFRPA